MDWVDWVRVGDLPLSGRGQTKVYDLFSRFRARVRGLRGVGFQPRIASGLRTTGAARMEADANPRDRQDRFPAPSHHHRQFSRIALAPDRPVLFFPSQARPAPVAGDPATGRRANGFGGIPGRRSRTRSAPGGGMAGLWPLPPTHRFPVPSGCDNAYTIVPQPAGCGSRPLISLRRGRF